MGVVPRLMTCGASLGTSVVIVGYPSTQQPHEMRAERITVAGKTVELR